ncbi:MAG: hypothetical protein GYA20_07900 [Chloroflexi bacterium]|nr:hypothetical protein [Chloroflexota bacterium]
MAAQPGVYIGIEPGSSRKAGALMVLDDHQTIQAQGRGDLAGVLAFAAGVASSVVAVNAPAQAGALEDEMLEPGAWIHQTPAALRRGVELHRRLSGMGYSVYPAPDSPRQKLETPAEAAYASLLEQPPLELHTLEGRLQRQLVLADCGVKVPDAMDFFEEITRWRLLRGLLPLEKIFSADELNALICAHVAWRAAHQPESLRWQGEPGAGQIALPLPAQR